MEIFFLFQPGLMVAGEIPMASQAPSARHGLTVAPSSRHHSCCSPQDSPRGCALPRALEVEDKDFVSQRWGHAPLAADRPCPVPGSCTSLSSARCQLLSRGLERNIHYQMHHIYPTGF